MQVCFCKFNIFNPENGNGNACKTRKTKQILRARFSRERSHLPKCAKEPSLKPPPAVVSELNRPWEVVVEKEPKFFSVSADEQVKVLADRFQKSGGFDMWSDRDGPLLFDTVV